MGACRRPRRKLRFRSSLCVGYGRRSRKSPTLFERRPPTGSSVLRGLLAPVVLAPIILAACIRTAKCRAGWRSGKRAKRPARLIPSYPKMHSRSSPSLLVWVQPRPLWQAGSWRPLHASREQTNECTFRLLIALPPRSSYRTSAGAEPGESSSGITWAGCATLPGCIPTLWLGARTSGTT